MLKDETLRRYTELTQEEILKVLQSEIETLTPEEKEFLFKIFEEIQTGEYQKPISLYNALISSEYEETPVDLLTFLEDDYYLGSICRDGMYPQLKKDFIELFTGDYEEVVLTGSIGWGKSFFASLIILRLVYELSCLKNPQQTFGLAESSKIYFVNISVTKNIAKSVLFDEIAVKLRSSPYFKEKFVATITQEWIKFPKNIYIIPVATNDTSVLGMNVFGGILDETNFMGSVTSMTSKNYPNLMYERWKVVDKAELLYNFLLRRIKSRFMKSGRIGGKLICVSSRNYSVEFTEKKIEEAKTNPKIFVRDYAIWEVKRHKYSPHNFYVVYTQTGGIEVCKTEEEKEKAILKFKSLTYDPFCIEVPLDFYNDFLKNPYDSMVEFAGIRIEGIGKFFKDVEKIISCIDPQRQPFFKTSIWVMYEDVSEFIRKNLNFNEVFVFENGKQRVRVNSHVPRYVHIDPSLKNDATGVVMGHICGFKDIERMTVDGNKYTERLPVFYIDMILKIVAPSGGEIIFSKVRELIYTLFNYGIPIKKISMDRFQSADTLQQFSHFGFITEVISVDATMTAYEVLKQTIYDNRLILYPCDVLINELKELVLIPSKKKVDHPEGGSKDVADALAGCIYSLLKDFKGSGFVQNIEERMVPVHFTNLSSHIKMLNDFMFFEEEFEEKSKMEGGILIPVLK